MNEFALVFAIPVAWAIWELIALERHRRRTQRPPPADVTPPADDAPRADEDR